MKKYLIVLLISTMMVLSFNHCNVESKNMEDGESGFVLPEDNFKYIDLWKMVVDFNKKGLPKSALKVVENIYKSAKENNNTGEFIKALIYKIRFIQDVEEETFVRIQKELAEELKNNKFPIKPVLHSMIAEQYWNYYRNNRYRFLKRTSTVEFKQEDMRTWDLKKIIETIIFHYQKSLENAERSKKTLINVYDKIIIKGNQNRRFRPTLYDFLAHRAIDFYMNNEAGLTRPVFQFTLNNADYFLNTQKFVELKITTEDDMSFHFYALKYLQDLVRFHVKDKNPDALIDADLKRLRFVYKNAVISNKEVIYEKCLRRMIKRYKEHQAAAEIYFELANLFNNLGNKYNPQYKDNYKWDKKKAHNICKEAIKEYPGSIGAKLCNYLINKIETKDLSLSLEKVAVVNQSFRGLIKYRNIDKIYLKIVKTSREEIRKKNKLSYEKNVIHFTNRESVRAWETQLPNDSDFQSHSVEIKIEGLNNGKYVILSSNDMKFNLKKGVVAYSFFDVSNISYVHRMINKRGLEFFILNRETGYPLRSAKAQVWYRKYNRLLKRYVDQKGEIFNADLNGRFIIPYNIKNRNYFRLELINGVDRLFLENNFYMYGKYNRFKKRIKTFFFTDRAIYRPGQTIYFKGIMLQVDNRNGENSRILENRSTRVVMYDVNRQKVSELKLKTNEYGAFSGTFQIPTGLLNGNMRISDRYGTVFFSVEEYKRPKFNVNFKPLKETYRVNDIVTIKGVAKAYAGYRIDQAAVKFRVVRQAYYPYSWYYWWYTPPTPKMEILNGGSKTDEKGEFAVKFQAIPDLTLSKENKPAFIYTVYVNVTDINGETRSSQKSVYIGYTALKLVLNFSNELDREKKIYKFFINSTNLSGDFVGAKGNIKIHGLKETNRIFRTRLWQKPDKFLMKREEFYKHFPYDIYNDEDRVQKWKKSELVFNKTFDTEKNKNITLKGFNKWNSGKYVIEMKSKDKFGNDVKEIKYFTLFSTGEKRMPFKMLDWFSVVKGTAQPGEKAVFLIGSSEKNVRVLFETEYRGEIIKKRYLVINQKQMKIEIPIKEKHRGNLGVYFTFVRHNRLLTHNHNIRVPWSNKNLKITFETFRNKLLPGEKEEWRIKIRGKKGEKFASEMLATLYDASLDAFRANHWHFNVFPNHGLYNHWQYNHYFMRINSRLIGVRQKYSSYARKYYDRMNWFGFYWGGGSGYLRYPRKVRSSGLMRSEADEGVTGGVLGSPLVTSKTVAGKEEAGERERSKSETKKKRNGGDGDKQTYGTAGEPGLDDLSKVKARVNFNETAFFYPHLRTNPEGEIIVSFTVPEALTKWKMMGFAHTRNLEYGFKKNELVTQKELMVVPNTPRFFREGDKLVLTSKITNLSEKELSGTAQLMLFDAATMQLVNDRFENLNTKKSFTVKKGNSDLVSWNIKIPEDIDAVTYRIVAKAGNFSDGEEQAVPVLKNRMLVTETLPLPVRARQTRTFKFKKLINASNSSTLKHHKLTLEFTSNPVWYAVQALPYLMEYPYECIEQTFSRYYANSIASYIVNSNPRIKRVFELWKNLKDSNALLSNLEKNQELKTLLLEETPWVLNAQNETERKKRIALLFDMSRMSRELGRALKKIKESQMASGAWPWFKGMRESRYITQHIVCGFAHLNVLKVVNTRKDKKIWKMLKEAVPYMDRQIRKDYRWLLKHKVNLNQNNLSYIQIHYLYARSYFKDIEMDKVNIKAFEYYKSQAKKYWLDFNKYMQGMISLVMNRYKNKETAVAIAESIKEHALYSEEMGMYWKESYGYYWYQAAIESHALLIEVFDEILNDQRSVDGLKTWLLKSKQTQDWRTTKATVEACYALLLKGEDWLAESKLAEITVGKIKIDPAQMDNVKVEAGTGYFKTSWSGKEIKPEMGHVKVKNNNKVAAWGSLYWQYFENLDKITPAKTPLKIKKGLFVERSSATGPVIYPIKKIKQIKIGDRIKVRIEIRVDRDMEYVHMKDMRASGFEPENVISRCKWQDGLCYYESTKDASTNFFFDYLPKGTYVFEYSLRVTHKGNFSNGITSIQCMYAPEFASHSKGIRVKISNE